MASDMPSRDSAHICSEAAERCPSCGYEGTRDEFEGWEADSPRDAAHGRSRFVVRCRECEALHPDQSNWDARDCEPCFDRQIEEDHRACL